MSQENSKTDAGARLMSSKLGLLYFLTYTELVEKGKFTTTLDVFYKGLPDDEEQEHFDYYLDRFSKKGDVLCFLEIERFTLNAKTIVQEILYKFGKYFEINKDEIYTVNSDPKYAFAIEQYFELKELVGFRYKRHDPIYPTDPCKFSVQANRFNFKPLVRYAHESLEISFKIDARRMQEIEASFKTAILGNFDQQAFDEFKSHILDFKFNNGNIRVPIETLFHEKFHLLNILKYLELTQQVEVSSWIAKDGYWTIKLISKELLALFIPNIDLLILKKDSVEQVPEVRLTEDGNLEYEGKPTIFDLPALQKLLCRKLYSKPRNYNLETIEVEQAVYNGESTKQSQEKLKKLIERLNGKIRDEFGIKKWIHYGSNNIRRLV